MKCTCTVRATSHLRVRLISMCVTVNEVTLHFCKIVTLITVKTHLQTGETLPHRSMPSCKGHFSLVRPPSSENLSMIIRHSFHVECILQYCFCSEKENGDTQAKNLSLSQLSKPCSFGHAA